MSKLHNLYTGLAGQYAVMSEFLVRGYNVAVPGVDRGDDIFVITDASGEYTRLQVKTSTAQDLTDSEGYVAQFVVPYTQLTTPSTPELCYALQIRRAAVWSDLLLITREGLLEEHEVYKVGTRYTPKAKGSSKSSRSASSDSQKGTLKLWLTFQEGKVLCKGRDLSSYRNNFGAWPALQH